MKKLYLIYLILIFASNGIFAQKGKLYKTIETSLPINYIRLSPDKTLIAVADGTEDPLGFKKVKEVHKIIILNSDNYSKKFEFLGHQEAIESLNFSIDSKKLVSADRNGTIILWDLSSGSIISKIESKGWVHNAVINSSGNETIATKGYDKKALLYSINGRLIATFEAGKQIDNFDINTNLSNIYFGCPDELQVWSLISRKKIKSKPFSGLRCMRFSHDYSQLALGTSSGDIIILDPELIEIKRLEGHFKPVLAVTFNLNDSKIGSASSDQTARIWDLNKKSELIQLINVHKGKVQAIEFISDRNEFMTGGENRELKIWK